MKTGDAPRGARYRAIYFCSGALPLARARHPNAVRRIPTYPRTRGPSCGASAARRSEPP